MIKIIIALVILACAGLFFIKGPDGEPLITIEELKSDFSLPDIPNVTTASEEPDEDSSKAVEVYKWQDEEGNWHFSNQPEDAEGAETIELDGLINTIPAYQAPEEKKAKVAATSQPNISAVPSLSQGLETLNQAKQLQSTIDQRKADLDKALQSDGKQ